MPTPQFWVSRAEATDTDGLGWVLGFKEITAPTNIRTMIAALLPAVAFGNKIPLLLPNLPTLRDEWHLVSEFLNSFPHDFVVRQKVHGQTLNWFLVEQFPILASKHYERTFGKRSAAEIVKDHVLRLTYTADDMAPFARDMGYVGTDGVVKPPIIWNEAERRHLRARLDALYFILYGVNNEDDICYILSTFPIVERADREAFDGVYLTRELILWYKRALEARDPEVTCARSRSNPPRQDARRLVRWNVLAGTYVICVKRALSDRAARPAERAAPAGFRRSFATPFDGRS